MIERHEGRGPSSTPAVARDTTRFTDLPAERPPEWFRASCYSKSRRLQAALDLLAVEPRPPAANRLVGGPGEWRVRTGDYRMIYEIKDDEPLVVVLQV
jgi:mRNA-degrading endonuclease RelE of RelBE toxin-antitoxin system